MRLARSESAASVTDSLRQWYDRLAVKLMQMGLCKALGCCIWDGGEHLPTWPEGAGLWAGLVGSLAGHDMPVQD